MESLEIRFLVNRLPSEKPSTKAWNVVWDIIENLIRDELTSGTIHLYAKTAEGVYSILLKSPDSSGLFSAIEAKLLESMTFKPLAADPPVYRTGSAELPDTAGFQTDIGRFVDGLYMFDKQANHPIQNLLRDKLPDKSREIGAIGGEFEPIPADPTKLKGFQTRPAPQQGCFIATAAYGSYDHPDVMAFRGFRDRCLDRTAPGQWLIRQYYRYSPPAAQWLVRHPLCRKMVRSLLQSLARLIKSLDPVRSNNNV